MVTFPKLKVNEVISSGSKYPSLPKLSEAYSSPEITAGAGGSMALQLKLQVPLKVNRTSAWATVGAAVTTPAVASAARSDLSFIVYLPIHTGRLPACSRWNKHVACQHRIGAKY